MGDEYEEHTGEITVPVPEYYEEMAAELDEKLEQDVRKELGKTVMDVLNETAKQDMDARK